MQVDDYGIEFHPCKESPTRARVHNPERVDGKDLDGLTTIERERVQMAKDNTPQKRLSYSIKRYEYDAPFNYPNVNCELGRVKAGTGAHPDGMELDIPPFGAVTIEEDEPIIAVTVIGSPCIEPGTVLLFGEPLEYKDGRTGVRYKVKDLYGEHLYGWGANERFNEGHRNCGLTTAQFEIPACRKVTIMGYSQLDLQISYPGHGPAGALGYQDGWGNDAHYNIRTVRVMTRVSEE